MVVDPKTDELVMLLVLTSHMAHTMLFPFQIVPCLNYVRAGKEKPWLIFQFVGLHFTHKYWDIHKVEFL